MKNLYLARIRKLEHRGRRGTSLQGLKQGRDAITRMSETEYQVFVRTLRKKAHIKSTGSAGHNGRRRQYKDTLRLVKLLRKRESHRRALPVFKPCALLSAFNPWRDDNWLAFPKRKRHDQIPLNEFSFIDNPVGTFQALQEFARSETVARKVELGFFDTRCRDIAPYMMLGLMHENVAPVFAGGHVTGPVADVLHAVNLLPLLHAEGMYKPNCAVVRAFNIRSRRSTGSSSNDNLATSKTREEKTAEDFVDTFNSWLSELKEPLELAPEAYVNLATLFGELLDNAKRHSDLATYDGEWHIAGFMEIVPVTYKDTVGEYGYICNFSLISLGNTIYESLHQAPDDIQKAVTEYSEKFKRSGFGSPAEQEALWNLCALQDGISRVHPTPENPKNGFGMMRSLVSLMNFFGNTTDIDRMPKMTIISGNSCIMVKYPYNEYTEVDEKKRLTFNEANSLDKPPDANHVFALPGRFPGTLITVKFVLDSSDLSKMASSTLDEN